MSYNSQSPPLDQRCAPSKIKNISSGTCFDLISLQKMVEAYNENYDKLKNKESYPDGNIIYNDEQFKNKRYLLKELTKKLKKVCDNQLCWLKINFIKNLNDKEISKNTFRPEGPSKSDNKYAWLSNLDIDKVMEQYEDYYKDFLYLDTVPIDFAILKGRYYISDLNEKEFEKLKNNGKYRLGTVINLDKHTGNGTHWVSLYMNIKEKQIYFFDSYGFKPEKEIREFIAKWANYMSKSDKYTATNCLTEKGDIDIKWNQQRHQRGASECGVYSISFILRLLNGEKFENINNKVIPDSEVNMCRKHYFTH
jgi:hypothetical protein